MRARLKCPHIYIIFKFIARLQKCMHHVRDIVDSARPPPASAWCYAIIIPTNYYNNRIIILIPIQKTVSSFTHSSQSNTVN